MLEQVEEYSNKVANVMLERGFKKGDVVGLLMENRPEFVGIWLGMSKVGIVTALINYNQRMVSLLHSIKVANCTSLIYGAELSSGKNMGYSYYGYMLMLKLFYIHGLLCFYW